MRYLSALISISSLSILSCISISKRPSLSSLKSSWDIKYGGILPYLSNASVVTLLDENTTFTTFQVFY
jgi:hypothetical protein